MRSELNLPLTVNRNDPTPLRSQLAEQLRSAICAGTLRPGAPLPSSRVLAARLGVARSTVIACFLELDGEGWTRSEHGSGTYVAQLDAPVPRPTAAGPPGPPVVAGLIDLRPGDVDPDLIQPVGWRQAWRQAVPSASPAPPAGLADLRTHLAAYLGSSRGLPCTAGEIVVAASTTEAIALLALAMGWSGQPVAVEEPGYPAVRRLLGRLGVVCQPLPVDGRQPLVDVLRAMDRPPAAVYLTPSHQYPLGHRIPTHERALLLDWARETGSVLVEDDYDGEFRYDVPPLASLAGLDPTGPTMYLGTMSKVLDPGLRLAYLRVPPMHLPAVLAVRDDLGSTAATPVQQAVGHLMASGELSRHIARVRRVYADRRRVLLASLRTIPAVRTVQGLDAGLHVVALLRDGVRTRDVVEQARLRGVAVADLDEYRTRPDPRTPALVLGYGSSAPAQVRRGIEILAALPALTI